MIHYLNSISSSWASLFFTYSLQTSVFLLCILLLLYTLRSRNIKLLNAIALLGLLKVFIPVINIEIPEYYTIPLAQYIPTVTADLPKNSLADVFATPSLSLQSILFLIWSTGVFSFIVLALIQNFRIWRFCRTSRIYQAKRYKSAHTREGIVFKKSSKHHSPFVFGLLRHAIILPANWESYAPSCKKSIIQHELNHISHKDHWINVILNTALVVHFFNPVFWIYSRVLKQLREIYCDLKTIKHTELSPQKYYHYLLSVARGIAPSQNVPVGVSTFSSSYKNLKSRIHFLIDSKSTKALSGLSAKHIYAIGILLIFMVTISFNCTRVLVIKPEEKSEPEITQSSVPQASEDAVNLEEMPTFLPLEYQPKMIGGLEGLEYRIKESENFLEVNPTGLIIVRVLVKKDGSVGECEILKSANKTLNTFVVNGLKQSKFVPAEQDRKPVPYRIIISLNFVAKGNKSTNFDENSSTLNTGYQKRWNYLSYIFPAQENSDVIGDVSRIHPESMPSVSPESVGNEQQFATDSLRKVESAQSINMSESLDSMLDEIAMQIAENKKFLVSQNTYAESSQGSMSQEKVETEENSDSDLVPPAASQLEKAEEFPAILPFESQPKMIGGYRELQRKVKYPVAALRAKKEGQVAVSVLVNEEGVPTQPEIVKSLFKVCDEAAINAIMQTRFVPAKFNNKPVPYRVNIRIRFKII